MRIFSQLEKLLFFHVSERLASPARCYNKSTNMIKAWAMQFWYWNKSRGWTSSNGSCGRAVGQCITPKLLRAVTLLASVKQNCNSLVFCLTKNGKTPHKSFKLPRLSET